MAAPRTDVRRRLVEDHRLGPSPRRARDRVVASAGLSARHEHTRATLPRCPRRVVRHLRVLTERAHRTLRSQHRTISLRSQGSWRDLHPASHHSTTTRSRHVKLAHAPDTSDVAATVTIGRARIVEHQMALFNTWADRFLINATPQHHQTLATYLRWGQQHRLARAVTVGAFTTWTTLASRQQLTQAAAFLDWLDERHLALADLDQPHLDRWLTGGTSSRRHANHFIGWAQRQHLTRRHTRLPHPQWPAATPLPVDQHRHLVANLINDETIPRPRPGRRAARHPLRATREPHHPTPTPPHPHHSERHPTRARQPTHRHRRAALRSPRRTHSEQRRS